MSNRLHYTTKPFAWGKKFALTRDLEMLRGLPCASRDHETRRLPQRSRRRRAPTSEPIGRGGTPCRPRKTDASERRPYHMASLPRDRALLKHPPHCKRPFFRIVAKPLANRVLRDIIFLFFERLVIPNAMIEKSPLPYNIESIGHPFLDFSNNSGK